jgi:hypothetical protein
VNESISEPVRVTGERTISLDCAQCGGPIMLARTGRRPRFCSDTCRKRASEERRAAARLGYPEPVTRVVREVIERVISPEAPPPTRPWRAPSTPPARSTPRTGIDWATELRVLADQLRTNPLSLVRTRDEFEEFASAVDELHAATQPPAPPAGSAAPAPTPAGIAPTPTGAGLSRQQRRALERQQRKQAH